MGTRVPILMYHSIGADDSAEVPEGWSRFHTVPYGSFRAQLDLLVKDGRQSIPPELLGQAAKVENPVVITFDDGHSSDVVAAEALHSRGLHAVFFITWSNLGHRHFLSTRDLCALDRLGFKIGSHGLTHVRLTDESPAEIRDQLVKSKDRLESLLGKPITDFAVPYGRYDKQLIKAALAAGYQRIMTSDFACANVAATTVMPRMGITSETTLEDFTLMLRGRWLDIARRRVRLGVNRRLAQFTTSRSRSASGDS